MFVPMTSAGVLPIATIGGLPMIQEKSMEVAD